uniref:Uncharacterized protein n=1 Tax=Haptolina brevifila TaxID=156173 RepID=A0A7S2NB61_9EUKA|mmetsp:Transcript_71887/g.142502  ORF Transcript_71887/g.142502 Transcript_71887/m.142502 type:complete len:448 (+) Transcript_71887:86-1429(+)|eukprot:CAMPEP_0174703436 /NCGR_PEP_ID=MMETSP1094-20130205/7384_1 /TAXON_ID=156173 /ORGANISM="Chrysochromulina brevifilum, Strain UTEX LB 985" /LENGTH=447 /DNA_ID=CAMNT_0015901363 /DNA_START=47 /DNA_END=1390 /DNA_ORIENTATION=-
MPEAQAPVDQIPSQPAATFDGLVSPPRGWPAAFREPPLKNFLSGVIKGRKARLTATPTEEVRSEVNESVVIGTDDALNAESISAALGWALIKGFAIFESEEVPGAFLAKRRCWNATPNNVWVDLTPYGEAASEVLLVEAEQAAAFTRAGLVLPSLPAQPPAAIIKSITATPSFVPVTPSIPSATPSIPPAPTSAPIAEPTSAVAPAAAPAATASATAPVPAATPSALSYDDILASISLGPKACHKAARKGQGPRPPHPKDPDRIIATYHAECGRKTTIVGDDPLKVRKKVCMWPGKNDLVRLRMRAGGTFELEARHWGPRASEEEELNMHLWEPRFFSPLEYGDRDAAILKCEGRWMEAGGMGGFMRFQVTKVEEERQGMHAPPISEEEIKYACGKQLGGSFDGSTKRGPTDHGPSLSWNMNKLSEWVIGWRKDVDNGWASPLEDED